VKFGIGRLEDPRLVTGSGVFTIDMPLTSEKAWRALNG
jgi:hypothetical protein